MNVLVYAGEGASRAAVAATVSALRRALSHAYDILSVDASVLRHAPWTESTALLVFPGGRDQPYATALAGAPNDRIRQYVLQGGRYLGICAGAYYACEVVDFDADGPHALRQTRELRLLPGSTAKGPLWPGFSYDSDAGALVVPLRVSVGSLVIGNTRSGNSGDDRRSDSDDATAAAVTKTLAGVQHRALAVYNGGCAFLMPDSGTRQTAVSVSVLASYEPALTAFRPQARVEFADGAWQSSANAVSPLPSLLSSMPSSSSSSSPSSSLSSSSDDAAGAPAIVHVQYGQGQAVLSGVHLEEPLPVHSSQHGSGSSSGSSDADHSSDVRDGNDSVREALFLALLQKMGLRVRSPGSSEILSPTPIFMIDTASWGDNNKYSNNNEDAAASAVPKSPSSAAAFSEDSHFARVASILEELASGDADDRGCVRTTRDPCLRLTDIATYSSSPPSSPSKSSDSNPSSQPKRVAAPESEIVDWVLVHDKASTRNRVLWNFDVDTFVRGLDASDHAQSQQSSSLQRRRHRFGACLLVGDVVTSTQTILEKNYSLTSRFPNGFVFTAMRQVAGRGRGRNSWISPAGCLQFSFILEHQRFDTVVLVQYLVAVCITEAIFSKGGEYAKLPVKIKWPNDIYSVQSFEGNSAEGTQSSSIPSSILSSSSSSSSLSSSSSSSSADSSANVFLTDHNNVGILKKVGGILVNSNYNTANRSFSLVVGAGVNVHNFEPSDCINAVISRYNRTRQQADSTAAPLALVTSEEILGRFMGIFERRYDDFRRSGFASFKDAYYRHWLHSDQTVTLEGHPPNHHKIFGITEQGLLLARHIISGETIELQPDGNSFDLMRNMIYKKVL